MNEDPAVTRAARYAALGHSPDPAPGILDELVTATSADADPRARAAALAALLRVDDTDTQDPRTLRVWTGASTDADPTVRRRAADVAPALGARHPDAVIAPLLALLDDPNVSVVEAAAWALGELGPAATTRGAVEPLATTATSHGDPLAREAAVAALGALGDPTGLPAILTACTDAPPIRRRAVLALAPFEGPTVDAALATALTDRDWQVRQAAEDLTSPPPT